jgi:hypothetical protein
VLIAEQTKWDKKFSPRDPVSAWLIGNPAASRGDPQTTTNAGAGDLEAQSQNRGRYDQQEMKSLGCSVYRPPTRPGIIRQIRDDSIHDDLTSVREFPDRFLHGNTVRTPQRSARRNSIASCTAATKE